MSDPHGRPGAKWRRPSLWVVVVLVFAMGIGFLARPQGQRATSLQRSSLRTTPDGVAALARGIERFGRRTHPRTTPLADADPVRGTIVLLRPRLFATPREVHALLDHVRDGGTLLYSPLFAPSAPYPLRTPLADSLGVYFRRRSPVEEFRGDSLPHAEWTDHALTEGLGPPHRVDHGFRVLGVDDDSVAARVGDVRRMLTARDSDEETWTAAAELVLGEGRVVMLTSAASLSNERAGDDPLAVLTVRAALAHTALDDTVFFAEYHQGIRGSLTRAQAIRNFFLDSPGGRALLHAVAVCFLILACVGFRFGAPMPRVAPPDQERRSPLEHVSALGDLYRKAGATRTAALRLLSRLARATRHPPPRDRAEADAMLRTLSAADGHNSPLNKVRQSLGDEPPNLPAIAAGIDEHLARRSSP
ncbi:MAG: DUF4350 domain-containing protein [Gemmatimonadetes bacterium]|nr:DUF4350 domain-containing protein [Gemmatimonadota bacterium]MCY3611800.1 DUF4350 domain-containing protein [Gemmatimonadota bacterium]MCY3676920.1 DUF4350 domain-containing protein [Gemmatimonadota bacterium]